MERSSPNGRDAGVDLVKSFAMFGVLLIHVASGGLSGGEPGSFSWYAALFWGSVSRAAVPLFFMCTGVLFLREDKPYTLKRILTRNLPHVLLALLFWALVYQLFSLLADGTLTLSSFVGAVENVLLFRHEAHLYYLQITLLVYLCIPLLRVFTEHATQKQLWYALLLWFVFGILYPTVKSYRPFSLLSGIPSQYALNMTWASLGYCLLGHATRVSPPKGKWVCPALWGAGLALVMGLTAFTSLRAGKLQTIFLESMSVPVAVMAVGIFGALTRLKPGPRGAKAAKVLSSASFCVYLSHMLFLKIFSSLGISASFQPIWSIPAIALLALAAGLLLWLVLRKIPFVNRWLI